MDVFGVNEFSIKQFSWRNAPASVKSSIVELDEYLFPGCENTYWSHTEWVVVYNTSNEMIAYGGIELAPRKNYNFLCRCGVLEQWRGHGIQKELIARRAATAATKNSKPIVTYTSSINLASMNSLISCGFRPFKPSYRFAGPYYIYWRLKEK